MRWAPFYRRPSPYQAALKPQNSRGENLNLRYNLAKRSVELLLRVRDEI